MASIFSKIIAGEIPSFKIAENDLFFAFLDIEPLQFGHVLIVPKVEVDKFYLAEDKYLENWMTFARPIILAIERSYECKRVGMSFIGLEVSHAHMHLVPINQLSDMDFSKKIENVTMDDLKSSQELILQNL